MAGEGSETATDRQTGVMEPDGPHLSVTQLKMYLRCPLQYFFRYTCDLKIPPTGSLTLGRAIHETLHDNYHQKIQSHRDLPISDVTDIYSNHWEQEAREALFGDGEKPGKLKDQGVQMLTTYFDSVAPHIQPVDVEREFLVKADGIGLPLKGYIDLIDDRRYIIDHKTSKRNFPEDTAEKDIQLTAYALAYRILTGRNEKGVRLDVMVKTKEPKIQQLQATRTQADIDRFVRLAQQVEKGINAEAFYPNENYMCGICGYKDMCEKW